MVAVTITIDDQAVKAMLTRLAARVHSLAPVMSQIGDTLRNDALANFKGQHAPDGTPWTPLSAATRLARARRLSGSKGIKTKKGVLRKSAQRVISSAQALLDTGVLRNSITVQEVTPHSVTVGSRIKYAAIHQFGGKAGRGRKVTIPARPYIGMSRTAERAIIDTINGYIGTNQ